MAMTWEFYVAMVLIIILIAIVVAFLFLLMFPQKNIFDKIRKSLKGKKGKPASVSKPSPVSRRRGQLGPGSRRGPRRR
jgi:NADH:ubiquinone oxidoreductase subunit 6 (subunit J)